jgi:UDP-N-acetylglucosamine:LPS N-acetylglucosamine transferase
MLVETDWDTVAAVERVLALVDDREHLDTMAAAARGLARMDAATRAADAVERVLRDRA